MTDKDHATFTTKTQREHADDLCAKYGALGNPDLVAALRQQKTAKSTPKRSSVGSPQMEMAIAAREQD